MASSSSASSMASAASGTPPSNNSNNNNHHLNNDPHGQGHRRMRRTGSNISSTSSDILVAPGPNATANNVSNKPAAELVSDNLNGKFATPSPSSHRKRAWLENGRLLKIRLSPHALRALDTRRPQSASNSNAAPVDRGDGPNSRGTYSKAYVQQHPEIEWVHRGQGRYLPAKEIKKDASSQSTSKTSISVHKQTSAPAEEPVANQPPSRRTSPDARLHLAKIDTQLPPSSSAPALGAADSVPHRRKRRAIEEQLQDSLSPIPVYGLRQRSRPDPQSPESPGTRPSRLSRRVNSLPTPGSRGHKTYDSETPTEYSEDQESDGFDDDDDEQTFDKAYVNAHPGDSFHHVGNGWYKKGSRSNMAGGKKAKQSRDVDDNTWTDALGNWHFDPAKPVHGSRLGRFPGQEFHHCGNGWYKAGAMPTQKRSSLVITDAFSQPAQQEDANDIDPLSRTYSKEDIAKYPDVEFVHRGNGRYVRKASLAPVDDRAPAASESKRPVRSSLRATTSQDDNETFVDPDALYDKSFVDAHPELEFHHRGQGRWKLGPRTTAPSAKHATPLAVEPEPRHDLDQQGLVDTAWVTAHPNETFHHKGQGRWARGLPPPGSSNKTAVRGPGAAEWLRSEDAVDRASQPAEDVDLPALTALVLKSEGPDKYPHIKWNYRGGGKWSRVTKQQWEQMNSGGSRGNYGVATFSKYNGTRRDIPSAKRGDLYVGDDDDGDTGRMTRRRRGGRGALVLVNDYTNGSSKSQSDPNTPRPPLMNPEDDILGPEDTPDLYRDSHSPVELEFDDDAGQLYRSTYQALNIQAVMKSLTKFDPQVRPMDNLLTIAANASEALEHLQSEYLDLEKITAPHSRIPRKIAKGGRLPVEHLQFEDRKEADLYDYNFDARRLGFQDPVAQRIVRDAEGRELRKRRGRHTNVEVLTTGPGVESTEVPAKRQSRQPTRFDGTAAPQSTRRRNKDLSDNGTASTAGKGASMTPDRTSTPASFVTMGLGGGASLLQTRSTAADGGVPKRIRELQRESSVVTVRSEGGTEHKVAVPRKGRPPGSKNHHKRRDAGIKKGPRKPKIVGATAGVESSPAPSKTDDEFDDEKRDLMDADSEPMHHGLPPPPPPPPSHLHLQHLQQPPPQPYDHGIPMMNQQQQDRLLPPFQPQRTSYSSGGGMIHDPFGLHHPPPSAMSSSSAPSAGYASAFRGGPHGHHPHQPRDPFQGSPTSLMYPDQRQHRHSREGTYPTQPGGTGVFHYGGHSSVQAQGQAHGQHSALYGGRGSESSGGSRIGGELDQGPYRRDDYGRNGGGENPSGEKVEYPVGYFLQGEVGGRHSGRV